MLKTVIPTMSALANSFHTRAGSDITCMGLSLVTGDSPKPTQNFVILHYVPLPAEVTPHFKSLFSDNMSCIHHSDYYSIDVSAVNFNRFQQNMLNIF